MSFLTEHGHVDDVLSGWSLSWCNRVVRLSVGHAAPLSGVGPDDAVPGRRTQTDDVAVASGHDVVDDATVAIGNDEDDELVVVRVTDGEFVIRRHDDSLHHTLQPGPDVTLHPTKESTVE